jgi:tetratricopeptide repeat protein
VSTTGHGQPSVIEEERRTHAALSGPTAGGVPTARFSLVSALLLLLFIAGRCLVPMDETDLFYNLRLGEIVLATKTVPTRNLLSFTYPGFPDPNLAWIFQIVLALAYRAGGIAGTVVLKTLFIVATFALLYRATIRRSGHPVAAALALALAAWAAEPRFVERPHLVTFLGLGYLMLALERAEGGRRRWLLALLPLGLVWANGNSCFFLAPAILGLYAAGAWRDGRPEAARLAGLVAACLVPLIFATPSGMRVIGYVANHFRMPTLRPLQEYRSAEWPLDGPFFLLAAGVALATTLLSLRAPARFARAVRPWPRDFGVRHLLPVAALAVLGARRIRFVAEFALLAGPVLAVQVTRLAARLPVGRPARRAGAGLGLMALVLAAVLPRVAAVRAGERTFDLGIEAGLVPTATVDWIEAHGLRDRLYNDLEVGSFLTWRGWPEHRVFQDPRINAYPADWHAFLRRTDLTPREWDAFLARFGVRAALLTFPGVNPRAALFDPHGWALVHRAADALVFARREPANAALIGAEEIPLAFQLDRGPEGSEIRDVPLTEQPGESTLASCEWQRRLGDLLAERNDPAGAARAYAAALAAPAGCLTGPGTPGASKGEDDLRVRAAAVALELDQAARAAALLDGLSRPDARLNRGFALLALGRSDEALVDLEAARAALPDEPQATFGVGLALVRLGRTDEAAAPLRALLDRWPHHFAAPEARRLLARLPR